MTYQDNNDNHRRTRSSSAPPPDTKRTNSNNNSNNSNNNNNSSSSSSRIGCRGGDRGGGVRRVRSSSLGVIFSRRGDAAKSTSLAAAPPAAVATQDDDLAVVAAAARAASVAAVAALREDFDATLSADVVAALREDFDATLDEDFDPVGCPQRLNEWRMEREGMIIDQVKRLELRLETVTISDTYRASLTELLRDVQREHWMLLRQQVQQLRPYRPFQQYRDSEVHRDDINESVHDEMYRYCIRNGRIRQEMRIVKRNADVAGHDNDDEPLFPDSMIGSVCSLIGSDNIQIIIQHRTLTIVPDHERLFVQHLQDVDDSDAAMNLVQHVQEDIRILQQLVQYWEQEELERQEDPNFLRTLEQHLELSIQIDYLIVQAVAEERRNEVERPRRLEEQRLRRQLTMEYERWHRLAGSGLLDERGSEQYTRKRKHKQNNTAAERTKSSRK